MNVLPECAESNKVSSYKDLSKKINNFTLALSIGYRPWEEEISIIYTKNTNSTTASRSYEGQGSFSPETYTRLYTNKKFQAAKWYVKKRSQVFVKYMIIFFTSWATREAHSAPYKCYTNNEPGVRTQLPLFLCLKTLQIKRKFWRYTERNILPIRQWKFIILPIRKSETCWLR